MADRLTSAPVLVGNVLVTATSDDMGHAVLRGLDIHDKTRLWEHRSSHEINEIVTQNGTIFFEGHAADFYNDPMGKPAKSDPKDRPKAYDVDPDARNITVDSIGVLALDVGSGRLKSDWYHVAELGDVKHFYVDAEVLIVTTANAGVIAYDVLSGKELWRRHDFKDRNDLTEEFSLSSLPAVPVGFGNGAVFLASGQTVKAINIRSGQTRWTHHCSSRLRQDTFPQVGNGLVIVLDVDKAFALDWKTGEPVWEGPAGSDWNTPAVYWEADCLIYTTKNGSMGLAELSSGKVHATDTLQGMCRTAGPQVQTSQSQQGGFFAPVIDRAASHLLDGDSGIYQTNIFFSGINGALFSWQLQVDQTNPHAEFKDRILAWKQLRAWGLPKALVFAPVVNDGIFVVTDVDHEIKWDWSSAENYAPRFVNRNSSNLANRTPQKPNYIKLPASDKFVFGKKDFSLEFWVNTTKGGELLTQSADPSGPGFRLAIANNKGELRCKDFGEARVQFAITEFDRDIVLVASSDPTRLTDGTWHHLCVVREENEITVFVDGISQPTAVVVHRDLFPEFVRQWNAASEEFYSPSRVGVPPEVTTVGNSVQPLILGAYIAAPGHDKLRDQYSPNFDGLIGDVRVWNYGLSALEVRDRCAKVLTGQEPGLVSYWRLMKPDTSPFYNDYAFNPIVGPTIRPVPAVGVGRQQSSLSLKKDPFPCLLKAETTEWPYHERWLVGGEQPPVGLVISRETLVFIAGEYVHAVDSIHGNRLWSRKLPEATDLVADNDGVYVIQKHTVVALDPATGARKWESQRVERTSETPLFALSGGVVVASFDNNQLFWFDKHSGETVRNSS
ncbi:MAG: PQQ-binding-like beta-propeller repeat protein, partial [Planctomycetaceae bacterium]|nr:PQQ-binding-like beta-propeller repeat protein [Planctomycetaceae bacterium]